ncbi:lipopolysaccharide biosynthesis protein [Janthinobacterium fluminis]|uniref:Membrane protein involved in the export of O-antigen and teichoic acid n=1 Tax=Janthinobacterium fluminis TaxID=2987524 RepID=A0ABT5JXZ8_9BURK|nr:hypothetical protein [Janthinobacterium fluminis]MDC8757608.1 hypothetical protein [Janthinobacterium fluminis]
MMFLLNLAGAGVSVFTIPISLKVIGIASYGHLVLVQSIALAVFVCTSFQYWQGLLVELPGRQMDTPALRRAVWTSFRYELLAIGIVGAVALLLHLAGLQQIAEFSAPQLLLLSLSAVFPVVGTHTAYFRLVDRYNVLMLAGLSTSVLKLICLHLVAHFSPTVGNLVLAYAIPEILRLGALFAIIGADRLPLQGKLCASTVSHARIVKAGKWGMLQAIFDLPVVYVDRIILGFALSGENLGIFSILKRIYGLINMATSPFYTTSIPEFAARENAGDRKGAFALWIKTVKMLFVVVATAGILCYLSKSLWMPLIFTGLRDYLNEFTVVLVTAVCAGTFVSTHALYWSLGKMRETTLITVATNVLYLGVLWGLTSRFGLLGTVFAFLVHVLLAVSIKILLLRRLAA